MVKSPLNNPGHAPTPKPGSTLRTRPGRLAQYDERLAAVLTRLEDLERGLSTLADDVSNVKAFQDAIYGGLRPYVLSRQKWK